MHYLYVVRTLVCACLLQSLAYPASGQGRGVGTEIDRQVDRELDRQVDRQVERQVNRGVERQVEQQINRRVERQVSGQVGAQVQKQLNRQIEGISAGQTDRGIGADKAALQTVLPNRSARNPGSPAAPTRQGQEASPYPAHQYFNLARDEGGALFLKNRRLLLIDAKTLATLKAHGVPYKKATALEALGGILLELDEADVAALMQLPESVKTDLPRDEANHLYRYQTALATTNNLEGWLPADAFPMEVKSAVGKSLKIGLIDSLVDRNHRSLRNAEITTASFVEAGLQEPSAHGTAIMSILAGNSDGYRGLLPEAEFFSASVFYTSPDYGDNASVKSILLALDWLAQTGIDAINMSLAGPPNPLLEQAVSALTKKGIHIVAAAGNGGPGAAPAFPAAYPNVIAVTAINRGNLAYYGANHGAYIDFAAPGVGITTATGLRDFTQSTGTSYAAPFVTALIAMLERNQPGSNARQFLQSQALDLGDPGFDKMYGYGKIRMPRQ